MMKMILVLHIAGGLAALLSMVIPMVTKKGGLAHRRAGWVFVAGMAIVSATALVLSAAKFADPRPGVWSGGVFLFYIAILTAAGVSTGVRVLRVRRKRNAEALRHTRSTAWWDVGISSLLLATSVGMAALGVLTRTPLFAAFSVIGFISAGGQLAYWLRPPTHHMHWWFEHMSSMLGSCIAATTAFLVVNADRMGASSGSLLVWLTPTLIGTPATAIWIAYYRRRFAISPATRRDTSTPAPAAVPYMPSRSV